MSRIGKLLIALLILLSQWSISLTDVNAATGARAVTVGGDVFLGGTYIEVGVSSLGSFGTNNSAPDGFHAISRSNVGLTVDGDGWDNGNDPTTGDFFLPGTPEERFILAYKIDGSAYNNIAAERNGENWNSPITALSTVDDSDTANGLMRAVTTGVTKENIKMTQVVSFTTDDKFFVTTVTIENLSSVAVDNVRYVRSFDPDQDKDLNGSYASYAKVISNPNTGVSGNQTAMVVARGDETLEPYFFISFDDRARASAFVAFDPSDAYMNGLWVDDSSVPNTVIEENYVLTSSDLTGDYNGYAHDDNGIAITFDIGTLAAGASETIVFYSSLDPNASSSLASIQSVAAASFTNIDYHSANFSVTSSVDATAYYIVVPEGSTAPTEDQIAAGVDYTGATIALNGTASLTADVAHDFSLSGLTQGGVYTVYLVTKYVNDNGTPSDTSDDFYEYSSISSATLTLVAYGAPIVEPTNSVSTYDKTTATFSGEVTSNNSEDTAPITERGFVYATSTGPTTDSGTKVVNDFGETNGLSTFSEDVTGLSEHTTYYVRSYAINSYGTTYGDEVSFTTIGTVSTSLSGVAVPVTGATQTTSFSGDTYTATVSWLPAETDGKFHAGTIYTANITVSAKSGYNLLGIEANTFTLSGTTSLTHAADSGSIVARYPETQYNQVIYNTNGGNDITNADVDFGDLITPPTTPTKYGNAFDGWYTDDETFLNEFDFDNTTMGTSDITLYAKWVVGAYTMSFDTNGGSYVSPLAQNAGTDITAPSSPSRTGYTFAYWSSDSSLSGVYEFDVMPGENTTIYAKWNTVSYGITYDLGGGYASNPTSYTIEDGFTLNNPTRTDYTFTGWTINGVNQNWVARGTTGSLNIVASWERTHKSPVIGELSIDSIDVEGAQLNLSVIDKGYPVINSYTYELTNLTTGETVVGSFGSDLNIDLSGLQAYDNYSIKVTVSNGEYTLSSNTINFKPQLSDTDNDGVPDVRDAYPDDSSKSMDVTGIQPDATPKRTYIGEVQDDNPDQYGIQITQKDLMGLDANDNILVVMGSVQFVIPVSMVDNIISNTHEDGAYLTLKVQPQIIEAEAEINEELLSGEDMEIVAAYDYLLFQVWSDGREEPVHELGGKIKVGIGLNQLDGEYDPNNMEVYFYNTDDGTIQAMKAVYDPVNQSMVFLTEHFSYYVLGVKKEDDPASATLKVLFLGIAIGIAIISAIYWLFKRKKDKKEDKLEGSY